MADDDAAVRERALHIAGDFYQKHPLPAEARAALVLSAKSTDARLRFATALTLARLTGKQTPSDLADALIDLVRQATLRIDDIEDRLLAGRLDHKRGRLGSMRRVLVRLQRLLLPEPAALFRLLAHPPAWIGESDVQDLRDATEEFSVVLRDMVAVQERVKLLQEEVAASVFDDKEFPIRCVASTKPAALAAMARGIQVGANE